MEERKRENVHMMFLFMCLSVMILCTWHNLKDNLKVNELKNEFSIIKGLSVHIKWKFIVTKWHAGEITKFSNPTNSCAWYIFTITLAANHNSLFTTYCIAKISRRLPRNVNFRCSTMRRYDRNRDVRSLRYGAIKINVRSKRAIYRVVFRSLMKSGRGVESPII